MGSLLVHEDHSPSDYGGKKKVFLPTPFSDLPGVQQVERQHSLPLEPFVDGLTSPFDACEQTITCYPSVHSTERPSAAGKQ